MPKRNSSKFIRCGAAWKNKSKNGQPYIKVVLKNVEIPKTGDLTVTLFTNSYKQKGTHQPDFNAVQ